MKTFIGHMDLEILFKYVKYSTSNIIYRNKKVLKGEGISVTGSLTAETIKMLEKERELHGFVNVWSQDGKMFFDKTMMNKVKVFKKLHITQCDKSIIRRKTY